MGWIEKGFTVIHNQADTVKFTPRNKVTARERLHLEMDAPYLLYIGKEHVRKGLQTAVAVCEELRKGGVPATLLVAGLTTEQLPNYAQVGSVKALGRVKEEDLPYLYNAASLLLHPSRYEGHPIAILEALASGTPVVASKESKVEQPASPAVEIISSGEIADYVKAVKQLISIDAGVLSVQARETVRSNPAPYSKYVRIIQEWDGANEGRRMRMDPENRNAD